MAWHLQIFTEEEPDLEEAPRATKGAVYKKINWLRAGILSCDKLLTVSPNYASEISANPQGGAELDDVIRCAPHTMQSREPGTRPITLSLFLGNSLLPRKSWPVVTSNCSVVILPCNRGPNSIILTLTFWQTACRQAGLPGAHMHGSAPGSVAYAHVGPVPRRFYAITGLVFAELARRAAGGAEGIVNGMDSTDWNPAVDKFLDVQYDARTVEEGKAIAKETLQAELGLEVKTLHSNTIRFPDPKNTYELPGS